MPPAPGRVRPPPRARESDAVVEWSLVLAPIPLSSPTALPPTRHANTLSGAPACVCCYSVAWSEPTLDGSPALPSSRSEGEPSPPGRASEPEDASSSMRRRG